MFNFKLCQDQSIRITLHTVCLVLIKIAQSKCRPGFPTDAQRHLNPTGILTKKMAKQVKEILKTSRRSTPKKNPLKETSQTDFASQTNNSSGLSMTHYPSHTVHLKTRPTHPVFSFQNISKKNLTLLFPIFPTDKLPGL